MAAVAQIVVVVAPAVVFVALVEKPVVVLAPGIFPEEGVLVINSVV